MISIGTYLAMSRDFLHCIIGLSMIGSGVNLMVFAAGRLFSHITPIILSMQAPDAAANPLPQALVLTAIVISFALVCFSLVLALRLRQLAGMDDLSHMFATEPHAKNAQKSALEDPS